MGPEAAGATVSHRSDLSGRGAAERRLLARGAVAEHLGDVDSLLGCSERLLARRRPTVDVSDVELRAHGWRIRAVVWSGDVAGARSALRALEATVGAARSTVMDDALARAWVAWFEGDISLTAEVVPAGERRGRADHRAEQALLTGAVHRERNRLAPALVRLREASTFSHAVVASLAASELARCHQAAGATADGLDLVVAARASCAGLPPAVDTHLRGSEVRLRLDQGDVTGASEAVGAAPPGVDAQLLAVRVALRQAPTRAATLLESVNVRTPRQAVEKLLLRAQLPDVDATEASVALLKAVAEGEPLGLVRTFLDEGPAVCRRLGDLAHESTDRSLGRIAELARRELAEEARCPTS
jgi:hypothetical protein